MKLNDELVINKLKKYVIEDIGYSDIPIINNYINFWMMRTQGGDFYDDFIKNRFIALGYNDINDRVIEEYRELEKKSNTKQGKENFKKLKDELSSKYNSKQIGHIISRCEKFIFEFKKNDIVVIPDEGNQKLSFARLKEYTYIDEKDLDMKEVEYIEQKKFRDQSGIGFEISCPYSKRWSIELLRTINKEDIQDNLFRGLVPSQSLYNMNGYSDIVLSHIYMIYYYKDELYINFNVTQEDKIGAKNYSEFIFLLTKYIESFNNNIDIAIKTNVNSPGQIVLILGELGSEALNLLNPSMIWFIIIYVIATGGEIGSIKMKSVYDIYRESRELDQRDRELDQRDRELDQRDRELEQRDRELNIEEFKKIKETAISLEIENLKGEKGRKGRKGKKH